MIILYLMPHLNIYIDGVQDMAYVDSAAKLLYEFQDGRRQRIISISDDTSVVFLLELRSKRPHMLHPVVQMSQYHGISSSQPPSQFGFYKLKGSKLTKSPEVKK